MEQLVLAGFCILQTRIKCFLKQYAQCYLKWKHGTLPDNVTTLQAWLSETVFSLNFLSFVSEKTCRVHQLHMVDGFECYNTHEPVEKIPVRGVNQQAVCNCS